MIRSSRIKTKNLLVIGRSCGTLRTAIMTLSFILFYLPYLSSIHEKAMYRYVLDGKSALAWELPFPGHLSST